MGRFADLLNSPSDSNYAVRPNDKNDISPPLVVSVVTTKTTKEPFGRFGRLVVARKDAIAEPFPFADALGELESRCPDYVQAERWQQCLIDAQRFLASWSNKAHALGWTADELFGLHEPPAKPRPTYSRLSRYDATGLLWLLGGRRVVAISADTAAIECGNGNVVTYRKHRKPALGPLGDSLDDFTG
jgi:hypothetical protein